MDAKTAPSAASAPLIDVKGLSQALAAFAAERDWDQYHSPKNLAMALTGEVQRLKKRGAGHLGFRDMVARSASMRTVLRLGDDHLVDAGTGLYAELRILLGADCIT